jgi:hypothetical protein
MSFQPNGARVLRRWGAGLSLLATLACAEAEPAAGPEAIGDDAGWRALFGWDELPVLRAGRYRQWSSRDRDEASAYASIDPGNKDFDGFLAACGSRPTLLDQQLDGARCEPELAGYLIASDDHGPGYISRIWLTTGRWDAHGRDSNWRDERIRIYADDLSAPVYEARLADWQARDTAPFVEPLTSWNADALTSYVPISYTSKLRVLLDGLHKPDLYYYQLDVHSSGPTRRFEAARLAQHAPRSWDELRGRGGAVTWLSQTQRIRAGQSVVLLEREQPGTIQELRIAVDDAAALADLRLQASWDDETTPSIDMALAWLFGEPGTLQPFATLPMSVSTEGGRVTLTLSLPMPFASAARLNMSNTGAADANVELQVSGSEALAAASFGHLHASSRQTRAHHADGASHVVADLQGRGKYVGTLLLLQGREDPASAAPSPLDFLEGDETAVIDGVTAIQGTGTEDFLNGAWYFESAHHDTAFAALIDLSSDSAAHSGALRALRWHILHDAIPFEQSFRLSFEIGANRPGSLVQYDSVAFYYLE